jgi:hypothetical protein
MKYEANLSPLSPTAKKEKLDDFLKNNENKIDKIV